MNDYIKNMPVATRRIIGSILPLVVVLILFFVVGKFGLSKMTDLRKQITKAQKEESILTEKLKILETVSDTLGQGSAISAAVMPESNPSLIVLTQLKILASTSGVFITNIKAGSEIQDSSGLSRV